MCFTPTVSIGTAVFEFIVCFFILFYFKHSKFKLITSFFIFLLGLYQLSEFFLCTTGSMIWPRIGFIAYTILPAIALNMSLEFTGKKSSLYVFILPILFSIFTLLPDFILTSSCSSHFVTVQNTFFNPSNVITGILYFIYYFGFITASIIILAVYFRKTKNKIRKLIVIDTILGIFISLLPALIFLFIFPKLAVQFPSVYCYFAVVFTICAVIALYLERRLKFS